MATASEPKLSMKLFVDTKAGKVLFAEAEKDCVDFLFNILSLHVGTVTRLLKEKGMNGCLPNLYDSVESLSDSFIQSHKNKDVLLKPKCSVGISSVPFLRNDVPMKRSFYGCASGCVYYPSGSEPCRSYISDGPSAFCPKCKNCMSRVFTYVAQSDVKEAAGGFVKEPATYMVMDDLAVKPLSTNRINQLLIQYFNVNGVCVLQEQVVNFGVEEALMLLKASFELKTVLTSVFLTRVKEEKVDTET